MFIVVWRKTDICLACLAAPIALNFHSKVFAILIHLYFLDKLIHLIAAKWCIHSVLYVEKVILSYSSHSSHLSLLPFIFPLFSPVFPVLLSSFIPFLYLFFVIFLQDSLSFSMPIFIPRVSSVFPTPHSFHITRYSTNFSPSYCFSHSCPHMRNISFRLSRSSNQCFNAVLLNHTSEPSSLELATSYKRSPPKSFH